MTENSNRNTKNATDDILRKRGWSINSSDHENSCNFEDDDGTCEEVLDNNNSGDDDGIESLFVESSDMTTSSSEEETETMERQLNMNEDLNRRKAQLSKWSLQFLESTKAQQRRTIIEPPQIIPLNGVYLKEFGKREREYDEAYGKNVKIERSTLDDSSDDNDDKEIDQEQKQLAAKKKIKTGGEGCKVRM